MSGTASIPSSQPLRGHAEVAVEKGNQSIRLPSLAEYRRLRDDPEIEWLFDEDGFPIAGAVRTKATTHAGEKGARDPRPLVV